MKKSKPIISILALSAAYLAVMLAVFGWMGFSVGTANAAKSALASTTDVMNRFDAFIGNASAQALGGIVPASAASALTVVEKEYFLDRAQSVAPNPNPDFYGTTTNPDEIELVISASEALLDGQQMHWNADRERMPDTVMHYYMDETILALNWKEVIGNSCYTFTEVKIMDASQFRRYLADDTFGSSMQYRPSEMASTVNAVAAFGADFYKYRPDGIVVYKNDVYRVHGYINQTLYVDMNGDFHFTYEDDITTEEQAKAFVEENNIDFSLAFGPILIDNGVNVNPPSYFLGEPLHEYSRSIICQLDTLHYLLVQVNPEGIYWDAVKMKEVADALYDRGIKMAYALDGGQTATCVFGGEVINNVVFGHERNMSDIIFFSTALPNEEEAG